MKRILTLSLLFLSVFVVYGAALNDSIKVYFALNKATFNPTLDNNAASMEKFIDGLIVAAQSGNIDHIVVYGYASPDGPFSTNDKLSIERCNTIADYISRHAGIPRVEINTTPGSVAWDGLRALVAANIHTPYRDEVIDILDKFLPDACTNAVMSDLCRKRLIAIDEGYTFNWMLENLFPRLRYSLAVYTYNDPNGSIVHPILENIEFDPELIFEEDTAISVPSNIDYTNPMSLRPLHRLAIKTNLLYYAALLPNLEVEWMVNDNWSVALEGDIAWWGDYSKEKSYRLAMISPEVKRWFLQRAPWHGLYVGAFAGGGIYDFEKGIRGYQGHGLMAGVSVGYMWPISRCLSFEAAIGAGYLYTRCKEYKYLDGCHVYQRTKDINFFGPLKVKFSLVWRLWDMNRLRRLEAQKRNNSVQYEK